MYVLATAGHVDHGKSSLVRALTGTDPDRLAEEKRRGLTIDLGYAWVRWPELAEPLAFVDVPGHERFVATTLAGLGPVSAVIFVVAADEGWRQQSGEHLAAIDALGLRHGLLVVTRADLADPKLALAQARAEIGRSSLGAVPAVACSSRTGAGLDVLRRALGALVRGLQAPARDGPVRLWVDRSFSIRGAGTVVTGTLQAGRVAVGDTLQLGERTVGVRGLQSLEADEAVVVAPARVALNLRGLGVEDIQRGDALCTPGTLSFDVLDVELCGDWSGTNQHVSVHLGTAAVPVHVRPLGAGLLRLQLDRPLPVRRGERLVLRDPGRHDEVAGVRVLDLDPPALRRRGAAAVRARELMAWRELDPSDRLAVEVRRRSAVLRADLELQGFDLPRIALPVDVVTIGDWLVHDGAWQGWQRMLRAALTERAEAIPLDARLSIADVAHRLGLDPTLVPPLASAAGLRVAGGRVEPAANNDLGPAEPGLRRVEAHLGERPFAAPEHDELTSWGVDTRQLAAAERVGRLVRLAPEIVLLPTGPALAMRTLSGLPQPFTTSQARQALGTTRRVAIPLLEHLDRRGWTRRLDGDHREVRRP